ncbi:hypothetical protein NEOLEDRAFT_1185415 [Neolentinus lepideus HHB14362 ss-1]|uniref:Uncharacterized protein n=1 Tax=Neolentinus lepideus HHB14362 ss-1 TaxID=1314782 RepID=A0A165VZH8_9AGAM|nr:hypothetical protein NEOLEDRAFT_1185415 [Neolentinus lepideus HHB14362 ss-1]
MTGREKDWLGDWLVPYSSGSLLGWCGQCKNHGVEWPRRSHTPVNTLSDGDTRAVSRLTCARTLYGMMAGWDHSDAGMVDRVMAIKSETVYGMTATLDCGCFVASLLGSRACLEWGRRCGRRCGHRCGLRNVGMEGRVDGGEEEGKMLEQSPDGAPGSVAGFLCFWDASLKLLLINLACTVHPVMAPAFDCRRHHPSRLAVPHATKGKQRRSLFPFQFTLPNTRLSPSASPLPSPSSTSLLSLPPPSPSHRSPSRVDLTTPSSRPTRTRNVNQPFPRYRTPRPSPAPSNTNIVQFTREQLDVLVGASPSRPSPPPRPRRRDRDSEYTYYCRALPYEAGCAPGVYVEYEGKAQGVEADLGMHRLSVGSAESDEWDEGWAGRGRPPGYYESTHSDTAPSSSSSTVGRRYRRFSLSSVFALGLVGKPETRRGRNTAR